MNRRSFMHATAGAAATLVALNMPGMPAALARALAQTDTTTDEEAMREAFQDIDGLKRVVLRPFQSTQPTAGGALSGMILALVAMAGEFEDADTAASSMRDFGDVYPSMFIEETQSNDEDDAWEFGDAEKVSMPRLGDKRNASVITGTTSGGFSLSAYVSTVSVQIDAIVQTILVFSINTPGIDAASDTAVATDGRWPDDARETQEDGLTVGGLWAAIPTDGDVPAGLVVGDDFETEF